MGTLFQARGAYSCQIIGLIFALVGALAAGQAAAQQCVDPPSGIVAWWPLDETSGTDSTDIEGTNDGVHVGGPVPAPGMVGGSLRFDGLDDYVVVPDSDLWAFGTDEFTIEFWANFDRAAHGSTGHPGDVFISNDEGPFNVPKWFFALNAATLDFLTCCGPGWAFSPNAPFNPVVGDWYHLAVTRSGTDYRIYVDGELIRAGANSATIPNINSVLTIGRALEPFGGFMDGRLDEMTIYNRALTQGELQSIYNAGANGGGAGKCKGPSIDTVSEFAITLGKPHSQLFEVDAGQAPFSWSVISGALPDGMALSEDGLFDGSPTQLGTFDFTVEVIDGNGDLAEKSFKVEVALTLPPSYIRVKKVGTLAVPGRIIDYFIVVENNGDQTVTDVPVVEILESTQVRLVSTSPQSELDFDSIVSSSIIPWVIPSIAPGAVEVLSYRVLLDPTIPFGTPVSGQACSLNEWGDRLSKCLVKVSSTALGCAACVPICGAIPPACATLVACLPEIAACTACLIGGVGPDGLPSGCLPNSFDVFQCFRDVAADCGADDQDASGPKDPNEKFVVSKTFIQPSEVLVYPIHFENIGEVEAIDVFVTDILDSNLDDSTLQILSPGATYDSVNRTLRWDLLGRNLQPGETGNVLLSIRPLPGLASGSAIRNDAEIQFEVFEPLVTHEVVNIIDSTPPVCSMEQLPATVPTTEFEIAWTGSDDVGEIESFSVFFAVDGRSYEPLVENTTETSTTFSGQHGSFYDFFCIAKDTAGNVENQELIAETTTQFVANQAPVANAGMDQTVQCKSTTATPVSLDGSGSTDPNGAALTYAWTGPFSEGGGAAVGVNPTVTLPLGTSTLSLIVNDGSVDSVADTVDVTVAVGLDGLYNPLTALVPAGEAPPRPSKASKQGRTLPLKLRQFCGSTNLTDVDVAPPQIVAVKRTGDSTDIPLDNLDSGNANDNGNLFRFSDDQWVYNFGTSNLSAGEYEITIEMSDGLRYVAGFALR